MSAVLQPVQSPGLAEPSRGLLRESLAGERILGSELVFVFGSNELGVHGKGAAAHAAKHFSATSGIGEGAMIDKDGLLRSYALPTKSEPSMAATLPLERIAQYAEDFKAYAAAVEPLNYRFQLTRVGCGLAGLADHEVLPLFADAPRNVLFSGRWAMLHDDQVRRFIVAGSRNYTKQDVVWRKVEEITLPFWACEGFEIVSGMAAGPDTLGATFAKEYGFAERLVEFPAEWDLYRKAAGHIRNATMAWYATDLIAFWDGKSPGTRSMIELAKREGLEVTVFRV